ncbi:MAG TPA: hypothetical protein VFA60_11325 [Terriglobales bacterium]|nr:hypothetical protein [Terriglobales bacterium]
MTTWILNLVFGSWNSISVEVMIFLAAIWLAAVVIKVGQVLRSKFERVPETNPIVADARVW